VRSDFPTLGVARGLTCKGELDSFFSDIMSEFNDIMSFCQEVRRFMLRQLEHWSPRWGCGLPRACESPRRSTSRRPSRPDTSCLGPMLLMDAPIRAVLLATDVLRRVDSQPSQ
jgi:hypothetical protein